MSVAPAIIAVGKMAAQAPIETKTTTGPWIAAGVWTLVALAFAGLIRGLPKLYEIWAARDQSVRDDKREDEVANAQRISALEDRMGRMTGALSFLANAVTVSTDALASEDPKTRERAAGQARELVAMAASTLGNEDPFSKALARMAGSHRDQNGKPET